MPERAVLALVGPTAAGKSQVALEVAERLGAEIVAVDGFTVYRGMDVGTAKPSAADRARVRHHMVDVLDPSEDSTVAWFQETARRAIADIRSRGGLALLVGGSGLYWRAVVDALEFPPTDAGMRAAIADRYAGDPAAAHAALTAADPAAAARMDPRNVRRAIRALEVLELTGRPFSDWYRTWRSHRSVYDDLSVIGLDVPRDELATRIGARVDAMIAGGLVEESRRLATKPMSATARQAIGYAEVLAHLAGDLTLEDAAERIKVRTRRYAARQQRWFAADPRIRWIPTAAARSLLLEAGKHATGGEHCS